MPLALPPPSGYAPPQQGYPQDFFAGGGGGGGGPQHGGPSYGPPPGASQRWSIGKLARRPASTGTSDGVVMFDRVLPQTVPRLGPPSARSAHLGSRHASVYLCCSGTLASSCAATKGHVRASQRSSCNLSSPILRGLRLRTAELSVISTLPLMHRWRPVGRSAGLWSAVPSGRRRRRRRWQPVGRALSRRGPVARRVQRRRQARALVARHEGVRSLWRPGVVEEMRKPSWPAMKPRSNQNPRVTRCLWRNKRRNFLSRLLIRQGDGQLCWHSSCFQKLLSHQALASFGVRLSCGVGREVLRRLGASLCWWTVVRTLQSAGGLRAYLSAHSLVG